MHHLLMIGQIGSTSPMGSRAPIFHFEPLRRALSREFQVPLCGDLAEALPNGETGDLKGAQTTIQLLTTGWCSFGSDSTLVIAIRLPLDGLGIRPGETDEVTSFAAAAKAQLGTHRVKVIAYADGTVSLPQSLSATIEVVVNRSGPEPFVAEMIRHWIGPLSFRPPGLKGPETNTADCLTAA